MYHETILDDIDSNLYFKGKILDRKFQMAEDRNLKKDRQGDVDSYKKNCVKYCLNNKINISYINHISGLLNNDADMQDYVNTLIPGSFGMRYLFTLKSPYFSRDTDELYIVQNPILKEYTTKIPMIRGAGWKGYLSSAALKILKEKSEDDRYNISCIIKDYLSYTRVFGTGSKDFRSMKEILTSSLEKGNGDCEKALISYCLKDLGINIKLSKNGTSIVGQLVEQILKKKEKARDVFSVNKGRGIFYPTYFNKVDYEIINPQDKGKRKGTNPIFYEVVPKGSKGTFQFIYIPFNGILKDTKELNNEIKDDQKFIKDIFQYCLNDKGIGAKTKLGWGLAEDFKNEDLNIISFKR